MIVLGQHLFPRLNRGGALQMIVLVLGFSEHLGLLVLHVDVGFWCAVNAMKLATQMDHVFVRNRLGESGAMPL